MTVKKHYRTVVDLPPPKGMTHAKVDRAIREVRELREAGRLPKTKIKPIHLHAPD